jgi:hypothetical protein
MSGLSPERGPELPPPLGEGKKAICYPLGADQVIKIERAVFETVEQAEEQAAAQEAQWQEQRASRIGQYIAPSVFGIDGQPMGYSVTCMQPRVDGDTMRQALDIAATEGHDPAPVIDFLAGCIQTHHETGRMPDLTARPSLVGWFRPLQTPNVIVTTTDGVLRPTLVDVGDITGGWLEMRTHPRMLRDAAALSLKKQTHRFRDRLPEEVIDTARAAIALSPVGY